MRNLLSALALILMVSSALAGRNVNLGPAPHRITHVKAYIATYQSKLASDIARGNGETIVGLSKVYGCNNYLDFGRALKSHYETIFADSGASAGEITQHINSVAASSCDTQI
jgi:hypothetical protein